MAQFIDLHSHIAWDIDDGLDTRENALFALKSAFDDGIVAICSTPHIIPGRTSSYELQKIFVRQQQLMDLGADAGVRVYSGSEVLMNYAFLDALDFNLFQPLNESRYLLVEFDLSRDIHDISYADEYLQEIVYHNMIPVIAHVERYFLKGLDLKLIDYWLDCGYVLQCNRSSLVGIHGKLIQKNAMALLKRESIHLVCSDCHRANGSRVSKLSDAYDWICCNVSREYAVDCQIIWGY